MYKGLYDWCLQELVEDGSQAGRDLIPWNWSLYFTARELRVRDSIEMRPDLRAATDATLTQVLQRVSIFGNLVPGDRKDTRSSDRPRYSMLGTEREMSNFELMISEVEDGQSERCTCWGNVSSSAEIDFRDINWPDTVLFDVHVSSDRFRHFLSLLRSGRVDDVVLRVGSVSGFFSDWSPGISTDHIKILTDRKEHAVEGAVGSCVVPPRLGTVGEAELSFVQKTAFDALGPVAYEIEPEHEKASLAHSQAAERPASPSNAAEQRRLLGSIRLAAWATVAILALSAIMR